MIQKIINKKIFILILNFYIIFQITIPKSINSFMGLPIRLSISYALIFIFFYLLFKKKIMLNKFNIKPFLIMYIIFILTLFPSLFITKNFFNSIYTVLKFISFGILFFIFSKTAFEKKDYKNFIISFILSITFVVFLGIIQYVFNINLVLAGTEKYPGIQGRISSTFLNPIYFGFFIDMFFVYLLYFMNNSKKNKVKFFILILLIYSYVCLILTFSRSSFLIFWIILFGYFLLNFKQLIKLHTFILIFIMIFCHCVIPGSKYVALNALEYGSKYLLFSNTKENIEKIENTKNTNKENNICEKEIFSNETRLFDFESTDDTSLDSRIYYAKIGKKLFHNNIFTGVGIGSYIDYQKSKEFIEKYPEYEGLIAYPHSGFILLGAEAGIFSIISLLGVFIIIALKYFILFIKNFKLKNEIYSISCIILFTGFGLIITTYLSENLFYDNQLFSLFIIILGLSENYVTKKEKI